MRCPRRVPVKIVISGTPAFWQRHATDLRGTHRIGIGFRTSYGEARLLDWSGYDLPAAVRNLSTGDLADRVPAPSTSGRTRISDGRDSATGAPWFVVEVDDWGDHWTPLVLEVDAGWTSRRGLGSCHVVLPELVAQDDATVDDARAASQGVRSVFDLAARGAIGAQPGNAVTFGRIVLRTDGQVLDGESRPAPQIVDRNPWTGGLGAIGDQAAVWTCEPPPGADDPGGTPRSTALGALTADALVRLGPLLVGLRRRLSGPGRARSGGGRAGRGAGRP